MIISHVLPKEMEPIEIETIKIRHKQNKHKQKRKPLEPEKYCAVLYNRTQGPSLISNIIVEHIIRGQPLYRQEHFSQMAGPYLTRQVQSSLEIEAAKVYLRPLAREMWEDMKLADYHQCDETWYTCQEVRKKGGNQKCTIVVASPQDHFIYPIALYWFRPDKKIEFIDQLFGKNYSKSLQKDGYPVRLDKSDKLTFAGQVIGCQMHCRRYFYFAAINKRVYKQMRDRKITNKAVRAAMIEDACKLDEELSVLEEILDLYGALYRLEKKLTQSGADDLTIYTVRNSESKAILEAIEERIEVLKNNDSADVRVKQAVQYYYNNKEYLWGFLVDPAFKLDTGHVERLIKALTPCRKNSLQSVSIEGAETVCIVLSLGMTAMQSGLNPYLYFEWVFDDLRNKKDSGNQISRDQVRKHLPYSPAVPDWVKLKKPLYSDGVFEAKLANHPHLIAVPRPDNPLTVEFVDINNPLYDIIPYPEAVAKMIASKTQG